jgi:serine/threonine protein kinase
MTSDPTTWCWSTSKASRSQGRCRWQKFYGLPNKSRMLSIWPTAGDFIHRDMKPANILLTDTGCAKLLDFRQARLSGADATQTAEGTVAGTAAYMAPEQAEGKLLDERTDIFSFGAVLYELISGTRAFAGNSMAQVLSSLLRDDPPVLQTTPALQTIVRKCLAKRPGDRFASVADLKAALEQAKAPGAQRQPSIAVLPFVTCFYSQLRNSGTPSRDATVRHQALESFGKLYGDDA